jgi:deazaflavin-dependent oxidoreductase (nitroreductase family)
LEPALRAFTKFHRWVYMRSGGWVGHRMTGPVRSLLLHTTGRRSGERRTVALAYAADGDAYLIVGSNFGGPKPPAWLANLRADPRAEINVGRRRVPVAADIVMPGDADYERLFAIADRAQRGIFERYRATMSRPLAVVRLVPT